MSSSRPHGPKPSADQVALIDELGGPTTVAGIIEQRLGYSINPQAVSMWKSRGIPYRYRYALSVEAGERGISVPDQFLSERIDSSPAPKPARTVRAPIEDEVPFLRPEGGA